MTGGSRRTTTAVLLRDTCQQPTVQLTGGVDRNRYVAAHPNGQVGNEPPGTVLRTNSNLRLGWVVERLDVTGHFLGFCQKFVECVVTNVIPTHGLRQKATVAQLFDIGEKVIDDGLVRCHDDDGGGVY